MEQILHNIISFVANKDFLIPLVAVFVAWLLAFFPQRRQTKQHTIFELMKNQMELLNRIEYKGKTSQTYFVEAKKILEFLYLFISSEYIDTKRYTQDDGGACENTDYGNKILVLSNLDIELSNKIDDFYIKRPTKQVDEDKIKFERRKAEYVYDYFFDYHFVYVGHYFRHLFNILKFIRKNIFFINRKFYTSLIQAQMSAPELFVLFYNGIKFEKMEKFINKYCLIENLAKEDLMIVEHSKFYRCKMKDRLIE